MTSLGLSCALLLCVCFVFAEDDKNRFDFTVYLTGKWKWERWEGGSERVVTATGNLTFTTPSSGGGVGKMMELEKDVPATNFIITDRGTKGTLMAQYSNETDAYRPFADFAFFTGNSGFHSGWVSEGDYAWEGEKGRCTFVTQGKSSFVMIVHSESDKKTTVTMFRRTTTEDVGFLQKNGVMILGLLVYVGFKYYSRRQRSTGRHSFNPGTSFQHQAQQPPQQHTGVAQRQKRKQDTTPTTTDAQDDVVDDDDHSGAQDKQPDPGAKKDN
eukprot:c24302_g1_i1.p1 GENE.c24302_g1_i1~~c24302_g1_i1.p1  ORF type:complete len:282 (-),score=48.13 c24302_g1_i1:87-896(-)